MQKGNKAPHPGHSLGRRALPPQGTAVCTLGRGRVTPHHPSHISQVAVAFVFPSLFMSVQDPKSQAQSASGPVLSQATSGTPLACKDLISNRHRGKLQPDPTDGDVYSQAEGKAAGPAH